MGLRRWFRTFRKMPRDLAERLDALEILTREMSKTNQAIVDLLQKQGQQVLLAEQDVKERAAIRSTLVSLDQRITSELDAVGATVKSTLDIASNEIKREVHSGRDEIEGEIHKAARDIIEGAVPLAASRFANGVRASVVEIQTIGAEIKIELHSASDEIKREIHVALDALKHTDNSVPSNDIAARSNVLERLAEHIKAQSVILPSWFWASESGARVRGLLRPLRPWSIRDYKKIRLGKDFDGGYVMIDDFDGVRAAISAGIERDVSWDSEIADRNIPVYQYDHTIDETPAAHPLFHFFPVKVAAADEPGALSINSILKERLADGQKDIILKIDIEGSEWAVFESVDPALLANCRQIICEFHELYRLAEPEFGRQAEAAFAKLTEQFFVHHIHGNNCGNIAIVGNVPVPESLEVLFANRRRYEPVPSSEVFPTPIDQPNQEGRADLFLGSFQF
jgi:Methyltransferase FkbM domain